MDALTVEQYGLFSYVVEIMMIISLIPELGTRTIYVKFFSASGINLIKISTSIFSTHFIIFFIGILLVFLISYVINESYEIAFLVGLGFSLTTIFVPLQAYSLANERSNIVVFREQILGLSKLSYIIFGWYFDTSYLYFIFFPYFQFLCLVIFWLLVVKRNDIFLKLISSVRDLDLSNNYLKAVAPYSLLIMINLLYNKVDIFMLEYFISKSEVGVYVAASKFVYPFMFLSAVFMNAIFPRMVRDKDSYRMVFYSMACLSIVGIILSLGLLLFSDIFFAFFSDGKYSDSSAVFSVLVFYLPIVFTYGALSNFLVANDKLYSLIFINSISFFVNIILNLILIPTNLSVGAAVATLISEVFVLLFVFLSFMKIRNQRITYE
ncbi:MAG: polysaccharide biosynthesis C-terminal domain-containing protein [Saprospiraceae bacterium]|nr:polysaccharide biosynthesis C-terminal domain-containing protein [Saprospiraceae bacterium]